MSIITNNFVAIDANPRNAVLGNDTKLSYHLRMKGAQASPPKHRQVYEALSREIQSGRLKRGDRLPSEAELVRTFGASRITVGRAVRDLQSRGLVERRAGSGTYVSAAGCPGALSFGLLIPDLGETDIFEPVCQGMMASPLARNHALVWGSVTGEGLDKEDRAWQLCRQYIERRVVGRLLRAARVHRARKRHQSSDCAGAR